MDLRDSGQPVIHLLSRFHCDTFGPNLQRQEVVSMVSDRDHFHFRLLGHYTSGGIMDILFPDLSFVGSYCGKDGHMLEPRHFQQDRLCFSG
jgi:hypothetical protein